MLPTLIYLKDKKAEKKKAKKEESSEEESEEESEVGSSFPGECASNLPRVIPDSPRNLRGSAGRTIALGTHRGSHAHASDSHSPPGRRR